MSDVALAARDVCHAAFGIEFDYRLGQIEINGAEFAAARVENESEIAHGAEMFGERCVLSGDFGVALENFVDVGVGHARGGANYAGREIGGKDFTVFVELHEDAHDQAVYVGLERANIVGEFFGQHRHSAIGKINGCTAKARFAIESATAANVVRDVCNVNLQMPARAAAFGVDGVVKIARRFAINCDDGQIAEIAAACENGIHRLVRDFGCFR